MKKHLLFIALLFLTGILVACTPKLESFAHAELAYELVLQSRFDKEIELVRMDAIVVEFEYHNESTLPDPTRFYSRIYYYFILIKETSIYAQQNMRIDQLFYVVSIYVQLETGELEVSTKLEGLQTDFDPTYQNTLVHVAELLDYFDEPTRALIKSITPKEERLSSKQMADIQTAVQRKFSKS